jgi:WD repeat and SOF domain-containing protein 1
MCVWVVLVQVRRIAKHRHLPKVIKKQQQQAQVMAESQRRKAENRRKHSRPDSEEHEFVPERKKRVLAEMS